MTQDVARALGDLQGTVRSMSDQWKRQEDAAVAGRRGLYERFESLSVQVMSMSHKLDGVTQEVAELRNDIEKEVMPTVDAVRIAAAQKLGAMWAGKLFWSLILGIAGAIGFVVHELLQYLTAK